MLTLTCDGGTPARVRRTAVGRRTEDPRGRAPPRGRRPGPHRRDPPRAHAALGGLVEEVTVSSRGDRPVRGRLRLEVGGDGADLAREGRPAPGGAAPGETVDGDRSTWRDGRHAPRCRCPAPREVAPDGAGELGWETVLSPGPQPPTSSSRSPGPRDAVRRRARRRTCWTGPASASGQDRRLDLTVEPRFADLAGLALADPESPHRRLRRRGHAVVPHPLRPGRSLDRAAHAALRHHACRRARCAPWPGVRARSTTRPPRSSRQDPPRGAPRRLRRLLERPPPAAGLLRHRGRHAAVGVPAARRLALGNAEPTVAELRPHLDGALGWMRRSVDTSQDGFLRYVDSTGTGLANQGWKDSGDAMRRRDGTIANAPIALVETQAYAVEAAPARPISWSRSSVRAATSCAPGRRAGRPGQGALLGQRRRRSLPGDGPGRDGGPVDGVGSNMGHVLGTGMLTAEESQAGRPAPRRPDLLGPYGIGTLGRSNPAYNPIGYHTGSIWTHDTAICALGLARDGHADGCARSCGPWSRRRRTSGSGFPSSTAATSASVGRSPTPPPAGRRPGRPPRRARWSRPAWAWRPTAATGSSSSRCALAVRRPAGPGPPGARGDPRGPCRRRRHRGRPRRRRGSRWTSAEGPWRSPTGCGRSPPLAGTTRRRGLARRPARPRGRRLRAVGPPRRRPPRCTGRNALVVPVSRADRGRPRCG